LEYVGSIPDICYFGVYEMGEGDRRDFMAWYDQQKDNVFGNRRVLEQYCQDIVTVLRQECQSLRRDFIKIGNVKVFLEALTFASACNNVLRKKNSLIQIPSYKFPLRLQR
jgi:hypothetical protein